MDNKPVTDEAFDQIAAIYDPWEIEKILFDGEFFDDYLSEVI